MNYKGRLEVGLNNRHQCSICGKTIPKDVQRISFPYRNRYGGSCNHRLCGVCIIRLAMEVDRKPIKEWLDKVMVDEL